MPYKFIKADQTIPDCSGNLSWPLCTYYGAAAEDKIWLEKKTLKRIGTKRCSIQPFKTISNLFHSVIHFVFPTPFALHLRREGEPLVISNFLSTTRVVASND